MSKWIDIGGCLYQNVAISLNYDLGFCGLFVCNANYSSNLSQSCKMTIFYRVIKW